MVVSATSVIAPQLEPAKESRQNKNVEDDGQHGTNVKLAKPTPSPSPAPESEADSNIVTWDGPNDPTNPRNWSRKYKWFITLLISINNLSAYAQSFLTFLCSAILTY
jgi:hypothetical protein